jgi:hypothetical protein
MFTGVVKQLQCAMHSKLKNITTIQNTGQVGHHLNTTPEKTQFHAV